MLKKVLGVVAALVVVFVAVVATRPGEFTVERSAVVDAPADVVFARVDGFKSWDLWSPWSKLDPAMTKTLTGPEAGKGAHYAWKGNDQVGSGNMTVTESTPPAPTAAGKVVMDLNFTEPFEAANVTTFNITPDGDKSKVSWVMTGKNNFMSKAAGLFMDMDKMIGADFEKGLADLKALTEKDAAEKKEAAKAAAEKAAADAAAVATTAPTAPTTPPQ